MASEAGPASRRFGPYPRFAGSRWLIAACWAFVFVAAFFDLTIVPLNLAVFYLVPLSFLLMSGRGRWAWLARRRLQPPRQRLVPDDRPRVALEEPRLRLRAPRLPHLLARRRQPRRPDLERVRVGGDQVDEAALEELLGRGLRQPPKLAEEAPGRHLRHGAPQNQALEAVRVAR
jgi:hypothetical protein